MVPVGDASLDALSALAERRKELKAERAALAKATKNEERKRQRRLDRAWGLSHDDLLMLVGAKAAAKAKAKAKAEAKAKAKAKAVGPAPPPPPPGAGASASGGA